MYLKIKALRDHTFHKFHVSSFLKLRSQPAHTYLSCVTSALPCSSLITIKAENVETGDLEAPHMYCLGMGFFSVSHTVFNVLAFFIVREHWICNVAFVTQLLPKFLSFLT